MKCQVEGCDRNQGKGRAFFCTYHWGRVPERVHKQVEKLWDDNPEGVIVEDLDRLIVKARYSLKRKDYEKRTAFHFKKHDQRRKKEKIVIVVGCEESEEAEDLWEFVLETVQELEIEDRVHWAHSYGNELLEEFESVPYCSVVLLGRAGVTALIDDYRREHGLVHGGNVALSPEAWEEHIFESRPITPTHRSCAWFSAPVVYCDANPEELEQFGENENAELVRALKWASRFLWKGSKA